MKAIRLHKTGGPEVLQLDEVPMPEAGPGQVLVKAHSIGAGIPDQLVRTGRYPWMPPLPTIPGIEMSGTVAARRFRLFSIHAYDERPDVSGQHLAHLMEMIKESRINPAIFAELALDMAAEAHRLIDEGAVMGKILLQPARTEPRYATPTDT